MLLVRGSGMGRPVLCCSCPCAPGACLMLALHSLSNVATQAQTARYLLGEPPDIEADEDVALAWSRFCAWLSACAPTLMNSLCLRLIESCIPGWKRCGHPDSQSAIKRCLRLHAEHN